jgi:outer membrane receptor protein involved in Fe transport
VKLGATYQYEEEGRTIREAGADKITYEEDDVSTWGGYLQMSRSAGSQNLLTYGTEYYHYRVHSSRDVLGDGIWTSERTAYPDNSVYYSLGFFLQDEFTPSQTLTITAGLRYSLETINSPLEEPFGRYEKDYHDLTGSVAISHMVSPAVNLIGRWSRGFRAPNLNDAVVLKYSSSGIDIPSLNLDAETCNSFEMGVKVSTRRTGGNLFIYYNSLSGLIDRRPGLYNGLSFLDANDNGIQDENEFDVYRKENVGEAYIYGIEYESNFIINETFQAFSNLSYIFGENKTDNEPLSRIPPLMGMLAIRTNLRANLWWDWKLSFAGEQRRLSQRDIDDTRIEPGGTPGWMTLSSTFQAIFGQFRLTALFHNILDEEYKEHGSGIYSPGRGVVLTLAYSAR